MARTNQGIFKVFLKRYNNLVSSYNETMSEYKNGVDLDFFEGLAQRSGDLYDNMDSFLRELTGMTKSTKFELQTGNEQKYDDMYKDIENKQIELKSNFNDCVTQIKNGSGLEESEIKTIDRYKIYER